MKMKLIASILAITTIIGVGYSATAKAAESKNLANAQTKVESTSNVGNENNEDVSWDVENDEEVLKEEESNDGVSKEEINEEVAVKDEAAVSTEELKATTNNASKEKKENTKVDSEVKESVELKEGMEPVEGWNIIFGKTYYFEKKNNGELGAVTNAYAGGYYIGRDCEKTEVKAIEKVKSDSEAESLIRENHKHYIGNKNSTIHGEHKKQVYKVESIRDEYQFIEGYSLTDEPAYIVNFASVKNSNAVYFSYAVGCYTGKVYMGNYKTPRLEEIKNDEVVAKHED